MTIFKHEIKQGARNLAIWTAAITFMMMTCIIIYPEMGDQMDDVSSTFAEMGGFTQAFGLDRLNFGEFIGFFAIECGNVIGLGGALFAALIGISALAKEEKEHTAEFLLSHPISRTRVVTEKLLAVIIQIIILNLVNGAASIISILMIDVSCDYKLLLLLFLSNFLMQIEISAITFGISAFLKIRGLGLGLGLAISFYFLNIVSNLMEETKILKYFTPFGYCEGADIICDEAIPIKYLLAGLALSVIGIISAYIKYSAKDIS